MQKSEDLVEGREVGGERGMGRQVGIEPAGCLRAAKLKGALHVQPTK